MIQFSILFPCLLSQIIFCVGRRLQSIEIFQRSTNVKKGSIKKPKKEGIDTSL